jgi:hypothetical protein
MSRYSRTPVPCANIASTSSVRARLIASLRAGTRRDGGTYVQVLYRLDGKQSLTSFEDLASAKKFPKALAHPTSVSVALG